MNPEPQTRTPEQTKVRFGGEDVTALKDFMVESATDLAIQVRSILLIGPQYVP